MNPETNGLIPPDTLNDVGLHETIIAIENSSTGRFYPIDKLEAHVNNIPHVAVSIFIFDENRLLIQQRAATKYHSAGRWANSVCTHPHWQESAEDCAGRRLKEELGWHVPLSKFAEISYEAAVGELFENEYVHCFYGKHSRYNDIQRFNPVEVGDVRWLTLEEIDRQMKSDPEQFSEWFKIYMSQHRHLIEELI